LHIYVGATSDMSIMKDLVINVDGRKDGNVKAIYRIYFLPNTARNMAHMKGPKIALVSIRSS